MQYTVIGASGRTGRNVVERLLERGSAVRAVTRDLVRVSDLVAQGAEAFQTEPTDVDGLHAAFDGSDGAFVMVQPNYVPDSLDFPAFQRSIVDAIGAGLWETETQRLVTLSSWGAEQAVGTGPVAGLHYLERRIDALHRSTTHLRPGYFMENMLDHASSIRHRHVIEAPFAPDVAMPFIATKDIGIAAADELLNPGVPGTTVRELHGSEHLSFAEATRVIATVADISDLRYVQITGQQFHEELRRADVSANVADLMVEVGHAINSGHTRALEPRSARTTTPTSFASFVRSELLPRLDGTSHA